MFYQQTQPIQHTTNPVYIGASVLGIKYTGGILIATDTRLTYAGIIPFRNINDRVLRVNENTMMGSSGDYSDFQEVTRILKEETLKDELNSSRSFMGPSEITNYLSSISYYKRNKMDPYLNTNIVGGFDWKGNIVLYSIDQFGTKLEGNYFTSSYGSYFCPPIIEPHIPKDNKTLSRREAINLLEKCFKVLYYKDCRGANNIKYAYLEKDENGNLVYDELERSFKGEWQFEQFKTLSNDRYM